MKRALIPFLFVLIISCQNSSNNESKIDSTLEAADATNTALTGDYDKDLVEAKALQKSIFDYIELVETKKMTKKEMDKVALPLQKRLDSLARELTPSESLEFDKYRNQLASELVDRKVERDN